MQIQIINGYVEYNGEPILNEINFSLFDGNKVAIVGRNGCGKTTLLKAITGEIAMSEGTGSNSFVYSVTGQGRIGKLNQTFEANESKSLEQLMEDCYKDLTDIQDKISCLVEKINHSTNDNYIRQLSKLNEDFERLGGYTYKKEYHVALKKFGFTENDLLKSLSCFSGGQRTKISLLCLLLSKPDVLLLDEPTNHLDIEAVLWLENFLINYKKSCIIVSHDRMFLDKIVNIVYEIEYGETHKYVGNYTDFTIQKRKNYDKAYKDAIYKQKEIARISSIIEKFRYKANKAKTAQAKIKQLERLGKAEIPFSFDNKTFNANFLPKEESVEKVFVFNQLNFGYNTSFGEINTVIKKGDKVGIIGKNGCGKSTLVKTIMGIISPISGEVKKGLHTQIGYFDQTKTQSYSPLSVLEYFHNDFKSFSDEECRNALGCFLFSGNDVLKTVGELSGGEKVRLELCKIFKKKPNVLILDEPTNHMDIIGKNTLENMLINYPGTVITVSHDRYFVNRVCNRIFSFEENNVKIYDCKYSEYEIIKNSNDCKKETDIPGKIQKNEHKQEKEKPVNAQKEINKKIHRINVLDEKITALEKEKEEINNKYNEPGIYTDYKKIEEIKTIINEIEALLKPLYDEWTMLMEQI